MASPAELAKLIENMKRGTALIDRAVQGLSKDTATMDRFEQRLTMKDGFMSQIDNYEKQMAAMDAIGNGGPPLDDTFQSAPASPPVAADAVVTTETVTPVEVGHISSVLGSSFDHATGDPLR